MADLGERKTWLNAVKGTVLGCFNRGKQRKEAGVTIVIFAISSTVILASAGLGVDTASLAMERSRVQHGADAAATAIAQDCASHKVTCSAVGAKSSADYLAGQNSPGATVPTTGGVTLNSSSVSVTVKKNVKLSLLSAVGLSPKSVTGKSTATWGGHPSEGSPVLPMGIPYCAYAANQAPATTPILFRSDTVSVVFNVIVQGGVVGRLITTLLGDLLGVTESCTTPDGLNLTMLRGPIWLSGLEGAVNGIFNWNSSICNMHLGTLDGFLGSTLSSVIPSNCMNKLGTSIKKGQIVLLPIYRPSITLSQLGLEMDGCLLGICSAKVPPRLGVKVLGFAPFKITGWNFSGNTNLDPSAPTCVAINLLTHPSASIGCQGITGYFVSSMVTDPNFTYTPTAPDYGAGSVVVTQ